MYKEKIALLQVAVTLWLVVNKTVRKVSNNCRNALTCKDNFHLTQNIVHA